MDPKPEPLYQEVGARPMTDAEVDAALALWIAHHPGERTYAGIEARLWRLNAEAHERAAAESLGIAVATLRQAKAEKKARAVAERDARDLSVARRAVDDAVETVPPEGRAALSRSDVLEARRRWQRGAGHPWKEAGVSEATYRRARHRYGLVPWPPEYVHKMTP